MKSDDKKYWIGTTSKGDKFLFNGNKDVIEYIKKCTWRKRTDGYFQNYQGERLHRVVMGIMDSNVVVDHINGEKYDNRKESLRLCSRSDNNRNKKGDNKIIGLRERNERFNGVVCINGMNVCTKTKTKDEAYIDLLIVQREYGYFHNQKDFYLLDNITQHRIDEVLNLVNHKLKNKTNNYKNKKYNEYKLSDCGKYITVYCNIVDGKNSFIISTEDLDKIKPFYWSVHKNANNLYYIHGRVFGKCITIHRYLFDLSDVKYQNYYIDHINGDSLDNTRDNLVITDSDGNNKNIIGKGYHKIRNKKFRASISDGKYNKKLTKVFDIEEEALNWYKQQKENKIKNRKIWKSKEELDGYISNLKICK